RAVDACDYRLRQPSHGQYRRVCVRSKRGRNVEVPYISGARGLKVGARAERLASACQDKDLAFIASRLINGIAQQLHRLGIDRITPFRTVERYSFYAFFQSDQEFVTGGHVEDFLSR